MDVLRTAKQAMDDGLIAQDDFDVIKKAFLKAQQIKAGIDAGETRAGGICALDLVFGGQWI